jgi:hypothetical protein
MQKENLNNLEFEEVKSENMNEDDISKDMQTS